MNEKQSMVIYFSLKVVLVGLAITVFVHDAYLLYEQTQRHQEKIIDERSCSSMRMIYERDKDFWMLGDKTIVNEYKERCLEE